MEEQRISIEDAIRVSQVICKVPEERLYLVLSVFSEAGLDINGLEELEEWRALKDQGCLVDMHEFVDDLKAEFPTGEEWITVETHAFTQFCNKRSLKSGHCRRTLARIGLLKTAVEGEKICYTSPVRIDGKLVRCVMVKNPGWKERKDEADEKAFTGDESGVDEAGEKSGGMGVCG